jgi:leader peptidase (prepilin peptidase) / N-methyltransferase
MNLLLFYTLIFVFSLCIGSFISMVSYRLPKMLYLNWFLDSYTFLNLQPKIGRLPDVRFNLFFPRSHCPNCKNQIAVTDNIPIVSYFLLKGKCRNCQQKISIRYPIIEFLTGLFSLLVAYKFQFQPKFIFTLMLTWVLILESVIDFEEYIIPDELSLSFLWFGLIINHFNVFTNLSDAIIGAIFGYVSFWSIYWLFKLFTGKEGLGYGDFKLLAMLGAWFGYQKLLLIILISSAIGSLINGTLILLKKHNKDFPIPFGPYLGIAGWLVMLFGDFCIKWYLMC